LPLKFKYALVIEPLLCSDTAEADVRGIRTGIKPDMTAAEGGTVLGVDEDNQNRYKTAYDCSRRHYCMLPARDSGQKQRLESAGHQGLYVSAASTQKEQSTP
jgi:hypothetical protein